MEENQYWYNRSSADTLYAERQHESRMNSLITEEELKVFSILKPVLTKDGDKWCVLYGENLQEGVSGFGDTPYKAIIDFNKSFYLDPSPPQTNNNGQ